MDPSKKRRRVTPEAEPTQQNIPAHKASPVAPQAFGEDTAADRERELAEAELQSLWDATEVIDMDKA
jgi:hypothetical protein